VTVASVRPPLTRRIVSMLHPDVMLRFFGILRCTFTSVLDHDCLNLAQASAYSAMVSLFPALIVAAAIVTLLPDSAPLRFQAALFFDRVLPDDVSPLLDSYFQNSHETIHSTRALTLAAIVSLVGASSVIVTLMEGFRRAFNLSANRWNFWERRWRSFALVFIAVVPLMIASILVVFGHLVSGWISANTGDSIRFLILTIAFVIRWTVALASSIFVIAVLYHMGIPPAGLAVAEEASELDRLWGSVRTVRAMSTMERSWTRTLPGATVATAMWFLTTLVFGWYVTRFANYSEVYGSLGAGVALLFWLYIISLSILAGAEFNAQLYPAYCEAPLREPMPPSHSELSPDPSIDHPVIAQTRLPG
jgi:membrane protein